MNHSNEEASFASSDDSVIVLDSSFYSEDDEVLINLNDDVSVGNGIVTLISFINYFRLTLTCKSRLMTIQTPTNLQQVRR